MDREIKRRDAKPECKDTEFYRGADEFWGSSIREEEKEDSEIYRTSEFGGSGRKNREERQPFSKRFKRMQYVLVSSCCAAVVAVTGMTQDKRAIEANASVKIETEESFVTEPSSPEEPAETLTETTGETMEEQTVEEQAAGLELSADEVEFLNSLWSALESDDMGTVESMVLSPEFVQITNRFQYENVEDDLFYDERYVYTNGEARKAGKADGETLVMVEYRDAQGFFEVYLGTVRNRRMEDYCRYFSYDNSGDTVTRTTYRGEFADSRENGAGEWSSEITFTGDNADASNFRRAVGEFKDGFLYNGEFTGQQTDGSYVSTTTVENGIIVHEQSVSQDGIVSSQEDLYGERFDQCGWQWAGYSVDMFD